jgi:hypothetical protein
MQSIQIDINGCGGSIAACFPECSEVQFGWFLKVLITGSKIPLDGTMLMCNVESGVYGWGALSSTATGYYGSDPNTFFAAVSTGAAGTYILDLGADADFRTHLVIGLGQSVVITGDPNSPAPLAWGTRSFEVKEGGALAMSHLALTTDNKITLDEGARAVSLTDCTLAAQVTISQGVGLVAFTDCALNFAAEGLFAGAGAAVGTSNTCPEVSSGSSSNFEVVSDSADPLTQTAKTWPKLRGLAQDYYE